MYYVYVLKSYKDKNFYIGSTNSLKRRFEEHNDGSVKSTRPRAPFKLIYYEAYASEKDARHRESGLKLHARAFTQLKRRLEDTLQIA